jgi:uncharacterized membrane protein YhaH (DUF805 family)
MSSDDQAANPLRIMATIFGISGTVGQRLYAITGFTLMAIKYAVEVTLVYCLNGLFYDPFAFLVPSFMLRARFLNSPEWLPWFIVAWSLPFAWVACTMSMRRAIDMGRSPWIGILVLIPIINIIAMLWLAMSPGVKRETKNERPVAGDQNSNPKSELAGFYSAILGVVVGGIFSVVTTALSAYAMHSYGNSLFLGMPIVSGAVAGFVYNQPSIRGAWPSFWIGVMTVVIGGLGLLLFAMEGVICLLMAAPMILPVGGLGGVLGWGLAKTILLQSKWMIGPALLVVPFFTVVERSFLEYREYVVESFVVVEASQEQVWENVVSFPDIETPPAWYFRLGVASPLRARIVGTGVGAVRHCEFTTGSFVEPITCWDHPNRLSFDVTDQPDPLIELTPYRNVRPPHLQHSFRSVRGEFELVGLPDGKTKLIGRTWYTLEMGPKIFWRYWTDEIIHRIHLRVLGHIKENATVGLEDSRDRSSKDPIHQG